MIATLVRHMRQADLLPATDRAEATMAIVKAYKNGKLLDLPPNTKVKVKAKGLDPQARAEKIAAALAGNADGEPLVKTHYAKAMRVFDRRLTGIERIVDPSAQLHIAQDAMAELYRNNDRFFKGLTSPPDVPNELEREMTRERSPEQIEAEKQRMRNEEDRGRLEKTAAEEKQRQRQEEEARQQQIIEAQQRIAGQQGGVPWRVKGRELLNEAQRQAQEPRPETPQHFARQDNSYDLSR